MEVQVGPTYNPRCGMKLPAAFMNPQRKRDERDETGFQKNSWRENRQSCTLHTKDHLATFASGAFLVSYDAGVDDGLLVFGQPLHTRRILSAP